MLHSCLGKKKYDSLINVYIFLHTLISESAVINEIGLYGNGNVINIF